MSDHLPIAPVPESTWLRALAHALDPEAETSEESLVPDDDPVGDAADAIDAGDDLDDDDDADQSDDDAPVVLDHDHDPGADGWDDAPWSPDQDPTSEAAGHHDLHHDDGIG
ncbi:hypothetical protein [Aeromicrobium sp.]|uniref:hypothetical protein n=1 Tax=Aeromicrobium sp. TaxID=1871063 RepID=UPI0025C5CDAB|nr:hypothetical protein [Aeromicrobium sp.]MCK5892169.1 hypothetical protein [Aeromicrobium sp.]